MIGQARPVTHWTTAAGEIERAVALSHDSFSLGSAPNQHGLSGTASRKLFVDRMTCPWNPYLHDGQGGQVGPNQSKRTPELGGREGGGGGRVGQEAARGSAGGGLGGYAGRPEASTTSLTVSAIPAEAQRLGVKQVVLRCPGRVRSRSASSPLRCQGQIATAGPDGERIRSRPFGPSALDDGPPDSQLSLLEQPLLQRSRGQQPE
jgi:hypothetical protein